MSKAQTLEMLDVTGRDRNVKGPWQGSDWAVVALMTKEAPAEPLLRTSVKHILPNGDAAVAV